MAFHAGKAIVAAAPSSGPDRCSAGPPQGFTFAAPGEEVPDGGPPAWILAAWPSADISALSEVVNQDVGLLFLGTRPGGESAVFACDLLQLPGAVRPACSGGAGSDSSGAADGTDRGAALPLALVDVRGEGQRMAGADAAVLALAAGLLSWHRAAAFCGRSGAPTVPESGGHARRPISPMLPSSLGDRAAPGSGSTRRPRAVYCRIDPAVIVAVTCGDWLLLGRKASWAKGRYSLLAGFAEVGESLEAAAAREVLEESGVVLDSGTAVYHSSQPWPFPQSLMIGFLAEAPPAWAVEAPIGSGSTEISAPAPTASAAITPGGGTALGEGEERRWPAEQRAGMDLLTRRGRQAAQEVGLRPAEVEHCLTPELQTVRVDAEELEDARWFHRDWLLRALGLAGSTSTSTTTSSGGQVRAACAAGGSAEAESVPFRIPGRYALANTVITDWLMGRASSRGGGGSRVNGGGEAGAWGGAALPAVAIDVGTFKYILIRVSGDAGQERLIVRGDRRAAYHNHILQAARAEAAAADAGLRVEPVGGGRMEHDPGQCQVAVYGYSAAFGQAPHEVSAALLRRWLPFHEVEVSYDGY